jgi:transposase
MRATRVYSREFRAQVVERILNGEKVPALSVELGIHRKLLYEWTRRIRQGGELRQRGRPRKIGTVQEPSGSLVSRIDELERLVGRQQLIIDFFKRALQRIEMLRQRKSESGATASLKPLVR